MDELYLIITLCVNGREGVGGVWWGVYEHKEERDLLFNLRGRALGCLQVFYQLRVTQEVSRSRGQTGQQVVLQSL